MSRAHGRSSGCFGCFSTGALLLGTIVPLAILWWIHPFWLERLMFWKPPLLKPPVVVISSGPAPRGADITPREHPRRWSEAAVRSTAKAGRSTSLTTLEGSTIQLPPGAVPDGATVRAVPVVELPRSMMQSANLVAVGPLHDLRVDGAEHWSFARPIRIAMPFDPGKLPRDCRGARPAIATWRDGRWQPLASFYDPVRKSVSASTEHACLVGAIVIGTTATVGSLLKFTETGQGLMRLLLKRPARTYTTKSFSIHYDVSGPGAVVSGSAYPLRGGRKDKGDPPLFVADMGRFLETARADLPRVGMEVAPAGLVRWDVFLESLPVEGMSAMGGPVLLDNDFRWGTGFAPHYSYLLRKTCTHELIHVAQDRYFNSFNAGGLRWWLESTAEYLAVHLLELEGYRDPEPSRYFKDQPELLAVPFQSAPTMKAYAYARFLAWMEHRGVNVVSLIEEVNLKGNPDADTVDLALKERGYSPGLLGMTLDFAEELYHRSLWHPRVIPAGLLNTWRAHPSSRFLGKGGLTARDRFRILSWSTRSSRAVRVNAFAEIGLSLPPLAVRAFDLQARSLPAAREARLVVQVLPQARHTRVLLGTMNAGARVPFAGEPSPLIPFSGSVMTDRVASPAGRGGDIDAATLLVANTSLHEGVSHLTLRRWLLMPPQWVNQATSGDGRVLVLWGESPLKKEAGDRAFAGYNVYRKERDASTFPEAPLNAAPLQEEDFRDRPPRGMDWIYAVTVVDVLGNESEKTPSLAAEEPFEGEWRGKVSLIRGTVSQPITNLVMNELQGSGVAGDRNVQRLLGPFKLLLRNIDLVLRIGVPMTIRVERKGALYAVTPVEVFGRPLENPQALMMQRTGPYTLAVVARGRLLPERSLTLRRRDTVYQVYQGRYDDPDIGSGEIGLRLSFKRSTAPSH
ncbi:MAG: hypothetical protein GXP47_05555 [Acidobacteria bacterium]|nr:hypothetical protein [Acidobacteriota bacterium]